MKRPIHPTVNREPDNLSNYDLTNYLNDKKELINSELDKILRDFASSSHIVKAMEYSLMAGGKRIRPILCLAATKAVGGNLESALPAACAIEMIHTYSLIHDDLPAMDDDELRRGKPTCHVAFDEATAILAGDALLTLAFQILSSPVKIKESEALIWLNVIQVISSAAGYKGMIDGQMKDIISEGTSLSLDDLENMHALKTGALIEASIFSGAILGNGSQEQIKQLGIYAKNIGLAFQVTDDILNVEGNPAVMGKAVGTDKNRKKSTYPLIMGLNESKEFTTDIVNNALKSIEFFDNKADPLRAVARYLLKRKK
ncbi:MAG: polyprenyl synthetase family protein [Deltaproteobacteria bacterium]|nr:polyprenyl synthetase family protein [Deltaproteobacteria bacterium]